MEINEYHRWLKEIHNEIIEAKRQAGIEPADSYKGLTPQQKAERIMQESHDLKRMKVRDDYDDAFTKFATHSNPTEKIK